MNFLDKIKRKRTTKIVDVEPKKETDNISSYSLENQNTNNDMNQLIGVKGKTFSRLEQLEQLIQAQQQTINALKKQVDELVLKGSPNARYVFDTYDGQYKNVKDIQINYCLNTDKVRVPGTSNYVDMTDFRVAYAANAETSNITNFVHFNNGTYSMDQLMSNYVPSGMLKEAVQYDTYDKFKEYINGKIK